MAEKNKLSSEDNALLEALGIEVVAKKVTSYTSREERIIAGFEEIQKFVEEKGRLPNQGEHSDIFERLYAIRLEQIRKQQECLSLLKNMDHQNLLDGTYEPATDNPDNMDDDELLAKLGVDEKDENSITNLKHVIPRAEKRAAEEIATRERCEDFEVFKPLFDRLKKELDAGYRKTVRFRKDAGFTKTTLKEAQFIIIGGQIAYLADIGETIKAPNGDEDARLRVIYDNGTESNILLRSLIRAMYKDETSRFFSESNSGPLFSGESTDGDVNCGTIYVLRSFSDHPIVKENRNIVHKIGVTGNDVKIRVANAKNDPTFLMANVEIVATYRLANVSRLKLEGLIQKFFRAANLDIEIKDRFGRTVKAKEWFLVPIFIIDEMVEKIKDGTISQFYYDSSSVALKKY